MDESTPSFLDQDRDRIRWMLAKENMLSRRIGTFIVFNVLARILLDAPLIRAMELGICREYYLDRDPSAIDKNGYVAEELCKFNEVQEALATMRGWFVAVDSVFGLINTVPMLHFGQTWDRRILVLVECTTWFAASAFIYCVCYFYNLFRMWAIYFAAIATLVGGTATLALSFLYAILAESVPAASLSRALFYISAGLFVFRVFAYSATAWMMQKALLLPVGLGFVTYIASLPLILLISEPRKDKKKGVVLQTQDMATGVTSEAFPKCSEEQDTDDDTELLADENDPLSATIHLDLFAPELISTRVHKLLAVSWNRLKTFYIQCPTASYSLALFFAYKLSTGAMNFIAQWSSKIFSFSLARMNYVHSFAELVGGLTLFALPTVTRLLRQRYDMESLRADALVARWSVLVMVIGTIFLALSWGRPSYIIGMAIIKLSSGFHDGLKAYATALTPKDYITTFYVAISVVETIALTLGEPVWAAVMNAGFERGGDFNRGPFLLSSILVALTGLALFRLKT